MKRLIFIGAVASAMVGCGGGGGGGSHNTTSSVAVSSSVSSSSSSTAPAAWTLVWSDEFDGATIDSTKWSYEKNCWGGGNNEQQCYTDQATNAFNADGKLNIVAIKEDFTGPNSPNGDGTETTTLPYTSARLRTKGMGDWTYGRFEIRAKLPQGQGTWPAIWMLATDSPYGNWAASGEIDIMEAVNLKTPNPDAPAGTLENRVNGTLHYGRVWPGNVYSGLGYSLPDAVNPADDFHTYAMEWEEGEIRWYVDGYHYQTQRKAGWYSQYNLDGTITDAPDGEPFGSHSKFHMLLNLAVGGSWAANVNNKGIDDTIFPQTMQVDYVKVYECSASPSTGKGCATIGESPVLVAGHSRPVLTGSTFASPPLFKMFEEGLATGLTVQSYNPNTTISSSEVTDDDSSHGKAFRVNQTGSVGNVYFNVTGGAADLSGWTATGKLKFDLKVNSMAAGAKLLVKIDSGWPNVSDVSVTLPATGTWGSYSIDVSDLLDNGNSLASGTASIKAITNIFVIEPSAAMDVSFDNIRLETP